VGYEGVGRFILFAAFFAGCGFSADSVNNIEVDLAGVDFAGADFSLPANADLSTPNGADLAGADLAGADLAPACNTCNCGQPVLLMAIESVNGGTGNDGRILQFGLGGTVPVKCGNDLQAGKKLDKSPRSLAWFPPDGILYGGETTLYLIDAVKDLFRWNYKTQSSDYPIATFPLLKDGALVVGAGFDTSGFDEVKLLHIINPKNGAMLFGWDVTDQNNSPIVLGGGIPSMAQSPVDPSHVFYLKTIINDAPAMDVAPPYDGNMVKPTVYWQQRPTGSYLTRMNVTHGPANLRRTVWLQGSNNGSTDDGIYFANDDGTGPTMTGPLICHNPMCAVPFKAHDAAPDPTAANRVFATCSGSATNTGHVVRIDDNGLCEVIFDGNVLPVLTYPSRLTIAEPR
jgi:hypothetical protein